MSSLTAVPGWDSVPELETSTQALGGPGAPMNTQAQALLDRTEQLNPDNLPSRGGSYSGAEIFTMKVGTTWVQGQVSDVSNYINSNLSVTLTPTTADYALAGYCMGLLVPQQPLMRTITPQAITLPANLPNSFAYCDSAPTSTVICMLNRVSGGVTTQIGTVTFAAGTFSGTYQMSQAVTTTPGDYIEVRAPATVDATFSGPSFGIAAKIVVGGGTVYTKAESYTPQPQDRNCLFAMNATGAVANTLPKPTGTSGNFPNGWSCYFVNISGATVTLVAPGGVSLNGVANGSIAIPPGNGNGALVRTDGTNWFAILGG